MCPTVVPRLLQWHRRNWCPVYVAMIWRLALYQPLLQTDCQPGVYLWDQTDGNHWAWNWDYRELQTTPPQSVINLDGSGREMWLSVRFLDDQHAHSIYQSSQSQTMLCIHFTFDYVSTRCSNFKLTVQQYIMLTISSYECMTHRIYACTPHGQIHCQMMAFGMRHVFTQFL